MRSIQAVIFDLDQTLLDRKTSLLQFLKWQTSNLLSGEIRNPAVFIRRFIELDANGTVWKDKVYAELIRTFNIHSKSVDELLASYLHDFQRFCVPFPGTVGAIRELSSSHSLGLISNGMSPFQERNFHALEFAPLFQSVIVSEAVGIRKPDPKIFELGCRQLGVATDEAVFVGDNPVADIEGAKNAGLRTIFIPSDLFPDCSMADTTCVDWEDLPKIVAKMA